jgi:hypothetical protein
MKTLDAENNALNGRPATEEFRGLVESIVGPMKGLLVSKDSGAPEVPPTIEGGADNIEG